MAKKILKAKEIERLENTSFSILNGIDVLCADGSCGIGTCGVCSDKSCENCSIGTCATCSEKTCDECSAVSCCVGGSCLVCTCDSTVTNNVPAIQIRQL